MVRKKEMPVISEIVLPSEQACKAFFRLVLSFAPAGAFQNVATQLKKHIRT
jgi:hypothetical protein